MTNPPNTSQEGIVGAESLEPTRGCEEGRTHAKSPDKSKAASIDALEPRVATLKTLMSAAQDTLHTLEVRVDGLEGEYDEYVVATKALMQDHDDSLRGEFQVLHDELLKLHSFMQNELHVIHAEVDEVRLDWVWHKHTLSANLALTSSSDACCINVPKPDTYDGACNAIVMDNFLFGLEQYFDSMNV